MRDSVKVKFGQEDRKPKFGLFFSPKESEVEVKSLSGI